MWLVRSTPGRADETLHITSQVVPIPVSYAFAPLTIQTATGTVTVKVEGTVETGQSPRGRTPLSLHGNAERDIRDDGAARARTAKPTVEGSTKTTVALPGPDEVLSFEMPPLRTPEGVTLAGSAVDSRSSGAFAQVRSAGAAAGIVTPSFGDRCAPPLFSVESTIAARFLATPALQIRPPVRIRQTFPRQIPSKVLLPRISW